MRVSFQADIVSNYDYVVMVTDPSTNKDCQVGFSRVSNSASKIEYDVIEEGGNDIPILLPRPSKQPETLTLEKGILIKKSSNFWDKVKPGMMIYQLSIFICRSHKIVKTLYFEQGMLIEKEYPTLQGNGNEAYIEKLQIAHSGLKEM